MNTTWRLAALLPVLPLVLAACGDGEAGDGESTVEGGPVTLTLSQWGTTDKAEQDLAVYQEVYPDSQVDLTFQVTGAQDAEAAEAFRLTLASGEAQPDIMLMNYTAVPEFASAGAFTDLGPALEEAGVLDNVPESTKQVMQYDDTYVGIPLEVKTKLMFYRKDLYEKAGIDAAGIENVDDLIAAGDKLRESTGASIWNIGPAPQPYNLIGVLSGNGAELVDTIEEGCEYVVASDPGVRAAFEGYKKLVDSGVVADVSDFTPDWEAGLASPGGEGTVASTMLYSWAPSFIQGYAPDLQGQWGVRPWPEIGGAVGGSDSGGAVWVVPEGAPNKDAAIAFLIDLYLKKEPALQMWEERSLIPTITDAQEDPRFADGEDFYGPELPEALAAANETYAAGTYSPASVREYAILNNALISYLSSDGDLDGVLQRAQDELQATIGCPYDSQEGT